MQVLRDYLIEKFGYNEPIFGSDLSEVTQVDSGATQLKNLLDSGEVKKRLEAYYLSDESFNLAEFDEKYISAMYISSGRKVFGYRSGNYLKRVLGIPYKGTGVELVCSSRTDDRVDIKSENCSFVILPCRYRIDALNAKIIQFLDFFNYLNYKEAKGSREKIVDYLKMNDFSALQRNIYFPLCSTAALGVLFNLGIYYEFADFDY